MMPNTNTQLTAETAFMLGITKDSDTELYLVDCTFCKEQIVAETDNNTVENVVEQLKNHIYTAHPERFETWTKGHNFNFEQVLVEVGAMTEADLTPDAAALEEKDDSPAKGKKRSKPICEGCHNPIDGDIKKHHNKCPKWLDLQQEKAEQEQRKREEEAAAEAARPVEPVAPPVSAPPITVDLHKIDDLACPRCQKFIAKTKAGLKSHIKGCKVEQDYGLAQLVVLVDGMNSWMSGFKDEVSKAHKKAEKRRADAQAKEAAEAAAALQIAKAHEVACNAHPLVAAELKAIEDSPYAYDDAYKTRIANRNKAVLAVKAFCMEHDLLALCQKLLEQEKQQADIDNANKNKASVTATDVNARRIEVIRKEWVKLETERLEKLLTGQRAVLRRRVVNGKPVKDAKGKNINDPTYFGVDMALALSSRIGFQMSKDKAEAEANGLTAHFGLDWFDRRIEETVIERLEHYCFQQEIQANVVEDTTDDKGKTVHQTVLRTISIQKDFEVWVDDATQILKIFSEWRQDHKEEKDPAKYLANQEFLGKLQSKHYRLQLGSEFWLSEKETYFSYYKGKEFITTRPNFVDDETSAKWVAWLIAKDDPQAEQTARVRARK